jgi:serine protease inhibitor
MRQIYFLKLIILSFFITFISCSKSEKDPVINENTVKVESIKRLADANQTFGWNLLKQELISHPDKNVVISPLSVQIALYMAINGAKGATENEMLEVLQCKGCDIKSINEQTKLLVQLLSKESGHPTLSLANGFFYDDKRLTLSPSFKNDLSDYDCVFEKANFSDKTQALSLINNWVKDKTKGKIDAILDDIKPLDIAFLINALYFKSDWSAGFPEAFTREDDFYTSKDEKKSVTFIADDRSVPFYLDSNIKVVDIPFKDSTYSLTLIRQEGGNEILNPDIYHDLIKKANYNRAIITFPKIKVNYNNDIIQSLKALGMTSAFNPTAADFTSLGVASNNIFINQLKHKVVLDIDEKGAEGAAVTSIGFGVTSMPPYLKFDKPFYIVLRHIQSNTIIFSGKINDPML